jgi:hypothetical protein
VYKYDLISGKVNHVAYRPGQADAFYHKYVYDAENRITQVLTSKDSIVWDRDAQYSYYRHGPLARTILGDNQVQGVDYAYTLQGWLKGVNSTAVDAGVNDMGNDGDITSPNRLIARDAYGYSLNYFFKDYTRIGGAANPFIVLNHATLPAGTNGQVGKELFNGNIAAMLVNIPKLSATANLYGYQYDQLNRITMMDAFNGLNNTNNTFTPIRLDDYHEEVKYDANGNILNYLRNGQQSTNLAMDNMTYKYYYLDAAGVRQTYTPGTDVNTPLPANYVTGTNQLASITDGVAADNYFYQQLYV